MTGAACRLVGRLLPDFAALPEPRSALLSLPASPPPPPSSCSCPETGPSLLLPLTAQEGNDCETDDKDLDDTENLHV